MVAEQFTVGHCLTRLDYSTDAAGAAHSLITGADFWTEAFSTLPTKTTDQPLDLIQIQDPSKARSYYGGFTEPKRGRYVSKILSGCINSVNSALNGYSYEMSSADGTILKDPNMKCTTVVWDGQTKADCIKSMKASISASTIDYLELIPRKGAPVKVVGSAAPSSLTFDGGAAVSSANGCALSFATTTEAAGTGLASVIAAFDPVVASLAPDVPAASAAASEASASMLPAIIGAVVGAVVFLLIIGLVCLYVKKKDNEVAQTNTNVEQNEAEGNEMEMGQEAGME